MKIEHLSKTGGRKKMQQIEESILEQAKKEGIKRFVVGGIIRAKEKVLLLRRKAGEFMTGIYEFPSGRVGGKESLVEALRREVKEETGLKIIRIGEYVNSFDYESSSGEKTRQFNFVVEVENEEIKLNPMEHDDFAWVELTTLRTYKITESVQKILRDFWKDSLK
ncbi:hypothetical protein ES703_42389 [subsurface metagenome]